MSDTEQHRKAYADLITAGLGADSQQPGSHSEVHRAFSTIPREAFLGPGPWQLFTPPGYTATPDADPAAIYKDVLVCLRAEGGIHNGQPSLHARCFAALRIQPGEVVTHIGAGTGYYSAIASELRAATGKMFAYEIEADLAARASANLAAYTNVEVRARSAAQGPLPDSDVIYVNAGCTAPLHSWLDALRSGGRLLFPLTGARAAGGMLLITRLANQHSLSAEFLCFAMFIPCVGARDDATASRLSQTFRSRKMTDVKSLRRGTPPDDSAWFAGEDWWLSTLPA